ncbi:FHA domain containing protein [Fibrella aestuarina BUZ 2]|uniref:FHA domain containing protein n=1 Tax=Fibrella aestuarina BUZ 2 TaxID=1166018 RepID=I0K965_9BACT|nr:FHA domain-containing protein [Fibrella aestuarina]CCH00668.1 FHA domain containing protein [Fibrella aestuarina BUZ 2]
MTYSTRPTDSIEAAIEALSQLPRYSIGRTVGNTIVVPNARVSSQHATLIRCSDQLYVLEDLASKHGTFVNDTRITRKLVGPDDTLRFADSPFSLADLLQQVPTPGPVQVGRSTLVPQTSPSWSAGAATYPADHDALDFRAAFAELKAVFDQYPKLRRDCRNRDKMIRTGSVIVSSVVGVSAVLASGGALAGFGLLQVLSGAGLSMLIPTLCSTLLSTDEKLELIDKTYRERYRCPNPTCRDPFGMREWEQLAQQKSCRRCKAIWAD